MAATLKGLFSRFQNVTGDEMYAFERRPCFESGFIICVSRGGDEARVQAVFGSTGRSPIDQPLPATVWNNVMLVLGDADFWAMPEEEPRGDRVTVDGEVWTLEGYGLGRRHAICRRQDPKERALQRIGRMFYVAAGLL